jgi:hypothetical protein
MKPMTRYQIHLEGVDAHDLSAGVLRDLLDLVIDGASRATRLLVEGRSTAPGTAPLWLGDASEVRVQGVHAGSLTLQVASQPLSAAVPQALASELGIATDSQMTAMDLLLDAVDDARQGRRDSDRLDYGLLQTFAKCKGLFGRGATKLSFERAGGKTIGVTEAEVATFQKLANETPKPKVDRVVGVLDSLTMSTGSIALTLDDDSSLKGHLGVDIDLEAAKQLLGSEVVVEGLVTFRTSGRAQRIEIDHVRKATARDDVWKRAPKGEMRQANLPVGPLSPYFGLWPGDETDDQIFAALRELG